MLFARLAQKTWQIARFIDIPKPRKKNLLGLSIRRVQKASKYSRYAYDRKWRSRGKPSVPNDEQDLRYSQTFCLTYLSRQGAEEESGCNKTNSIAYENDGNCAVVNVILSGMRLVRFVNMACWSPYLSILSIRAPGAASFIPLEKAMKHEARTRNLFL